MPRTAVMSPTILCADPDRNLCQVLARALGADGIRVHAAHDGAAALRVVAESRPQLVVIDLGLPGRDGLAVLGAIRARQDACAGMPAIFLTAAAPSAPQVERARKLGASAILMKPVALDNLTGRIGKLLPRANAEPAAAPRGRAVRTAPLRGALEALPFPALLHEVHGLRASGVLRFEDGPRRKDIELVDGRAASVRSNLPGERLGEWLLRSGRIDRTVFQESIRRMHRGEGLQGEVLRAMQALTEEELADALQQHADEKLFEIFAWRRGRYELTLGARLERASTLAVRRSPADVIRVGVATRFPIERIDAVLRSHADHFAFASSNPFYSFQEIELDDADVKLLVEGERGIALRSLLVRPIEVRRSAYALLETALLELRDGASVRSRGPAARVRLHGQPPRAGAGAAPPAAQQGARAAAASPAADPAPAQAPAPRPTPRATATAATARTAAAGEPAEHAHYAADHEQRAALAALLVRLRSPSPFEKLGLRPDATALEIRTAYTELAKRAHPDRFAAASEVVRDLAEEAFREITRAYQALSDPSDLAAYRADPIRDARNAKAQEEAQRALAAEQEFQRGEARLRAYDWAGALAHFERACELYPDEGEYLAFYGWSYYLTHGHDEQVFRKAFELVRRGAKLAPERDKPYLFLGRLCQAAGRLEMAEKMFTKAVERRPDSTEALRELRLLAMRKPKQGIVGRILRRPGDGRKKSGHRAS
ncbi:MAG: response regulator [Deltaproteobacteria bacterium]|nr:response regulator [Deltaproteobacteria bacterium]